MDPPLVTICIYGVMFILFASIVDSTDPLPDPVLPQPRQPNHSPPSPPHPPSLFMPAPPPPTLFIPQPPPKSSKPKPKKPPPPFAPAPGPSWLASPPNGRPFVSSPPPVQGEQTNPNVLNTDNDIRNDLGRKIGWIFVGVVIIMQVFVVIFLVIKRRQLFHPDHV